MPSQNSVIAMRNRKSNPALIPALLIAGTTLAVGGGLVYAASRPMKMKLKAKAPKGFPLLIGELTDQGIFFTHVADHDKVQADFLVVTRDTDQEWATEVAKWLVDNINKAQKNITIFIENSPRSEQLGLVLKAALQIEMIKASKNGEMPFRPTFSHGDWEQAHNEAHQGQTENPAWPFVVGGVALGSAALGATWWNKCADGNPFLDLDSKDYPGMTIFLSKDDNALCYFGKRYAVRLHPSDWTETNGELAIKRFFTENAARIFFEDENGLAKWIDDETVGREEWVKS